MKKLQTGRGFFRIRDFKVAFNTRIIFMSLDSAASNGIFQYYTFFQTLMIVLGIIESIHLCRMAERRTQYNVESLESNMTFP